jgi:hypothetical protein
LPDEQTQALAALVAADAKGGINMLTAEKNRLRLEARPIQKRMQARITCLERELATTTSQEPKPRPISLTISSAVTIPDSAGGSNCSNRGNHS